MANTSATARAISNTRNEFRARTQVGLGLRLGLCLG
jgi:hypothetical protein